MNTAMVSFALLAIVMGVGISSEASPPPNADFGASIANAPSVKSFTCQANMVPEFHKANQWMSAQHPGWTESIAQAMVFDEFLRQSHDCPAPSRWKPIRRPYTKLRQRAQRGDSAAETALGVAYQSDLGRTPDFLNVLRCMHEQNAKHPEWVKVMYPPEALYDKCWPHDYVKAVEWFSKAASHGYPSAELHLGLMYELGHGVPQSYTTAYQWLERAARSGDAKARYQLVFLYERGHGPVKGSPQVLSWIREYAAKPNGMLQIQAQAALGVMYEKGEGVPQNYEIAEKWFCVAFNSMSNIADGFSLGDLIMNGMSRVAKHLTYRQDVDARKSANVWSAAHYPHPSYYLDP